jgi:hypothetical protein
MLSSALDWAANILSAGIEFGGAGQSVQASWSYARLVTKPAHRRLTSLCEDALKLLGLGRGRLTLFP